MKRPAFTDYAVGHPLVMLGLGLLSVFVLYQCLFAEMSWLVGGTVLLAARWSWGAFGRVDAYRSWKREWDGMGGQPQAQSGTSLRWLRRTGAVVILGLAALYLYANRDDPIYLAGLYWMAGCLAIGALVWLKRALHRRRAAHQSTASDDAVVTIVPRGPLLEIPPLQVAYQRLPPHCHRALQQARLSDQRH